ncbi:hypothetical protein KFE25_008333 [Diacronema lutheri]|uniref:Uncharacterized protein n=2 Tax=Diacronema lutheri TaxID=2081491 RepID=A0A8J5XUW1_DIALT|nr:hypothetical protein KFE25_008333 [Diacronema lutheri]
MANQKQTVPPLATIALGVVMAVVSGAMLALDRTPIVTLEQAGGSEAVGPACLCALRGLFALGHAFMIVQTALLPAMPLIAVYKRELGSHLQTETIWLRGLPRLCSFFTIWCFAAQGAFFALGAACSAALALGAEGVVPARVLYITHLLFEMTAGCGLVVTVVVSFVIWPELLRFGVQHDLDEPQNLVMHNWNVLEILTELLIGQLPITVAHAAVGIAWGTAFIAFSWLRAPALARLAREGKGRSAGNGVNFPYFFLDITLPRATQYAFLLGLLAVLLTFYFGAMALRELLLVSARCGVPLLARAAATYAVGYMLTKWRD